MSAISAITLQLYQYQNLYFLNFLNKSYFWKCFLKLFYLVWMFYLLKWKPFKMMKKAFYFILKTPFFLKILKFLFWLFGYMEKTIWLKI